MSQIDVLIPYTDPDYSETVKAEIVGSDTWELRTHAAFAPLAPGDQVRINQASELIALLRLEPVYIYSVHCHLPAGVTFGIGPTDDHPAVQKVDQLLAEWQRETWVTRTSTFTFTLSAPTTQWFTERVESHPLVQFTDIVRTPTTRVRLLEVLANPSFGGTP